jgi:hypothetical protein
MADEARLRPVLARVDAVMHFAAHAYVGESVENPRKYFQNNVVAALSLLNFALDAGIRRFVFSSTCAVYGVPGQIPITEQTPREPVNPYGASKLFFENALEAYSRAYGLRSVSLRYFNAAGADESGEIGEKHEPETHLIPLSLAASSENGPELQVYGSDYPTADGTCLRDYIHVNDLADAHVRALQYLEKGGDSWPSIWEQAGDIPSSKSSGQRKAPLDGRFGERSDRGGRAILRCWWPIRRRLKECWDGPPSAISPTSSRVHGHGCRKHRAALEQSRGGFSGCQSRLVFTYAAAHGISNSVRLVVRLHFVAVFLSVALLRRRSLTPSRWNRL